MLNLLLFFQNTETNPENKASGKVVEFVDNNVLYYIFKYELFKIGNSSIKIIDIIVFFVAVLIVVIISRLLRNLLTTRLLKRTSMRPATSHLVGTIAQYVVIFFGFIITLQLVGIDLTSLNVLAGAIGVGIGFGLQNVANNFIAGLIILYEQPFQVGDRIEIGTIKGKIVDIGGRSSRILHDDETIYIIPNLKLITDPVRNFRRSGDHVPHEIKIFVGYGNDAVKVLEIMRAVAYEHTQVLKDPEPNALLKSFDVGKLDFILNVWVAKEMKEIDKFLSDLNVQIYAKFLESNITTRSPIDANISQQEMNETAASELTLEETE
ncbi:MAG: mechanosensitive ion channel domain-containing protein [Pyrinomonadaceae bacterium]